MKRDQEQLWDTVKLLSNIDRGKAELVLKTTIEKSLQLMNLHTPIISKTHFSIPDEKYLSKLKELESEIHKQISESASNRTYEYIVEYINLLGDISDEPKETSKKVIASLLAGKVKGSKFPRLNEQAIEPIITFQKEEVRYYTPNEVGKKLGLSDQTIRRMCEKGRFEGAYKTEGGHWKVPEDIFITTREQDRRGDQVLQHIDGKNSEVGDVDEFDL